MSIYLSVGISVTVKGYINCKPLNKLNKHGFPFCRVDWNEAGPTKFQGNKHTVEMNTFVSL